MDMLENWLKQNPDARLIIIDTLGLVRGMKRKNEDPYQYDYRLLAALRELAEKYRVSIILVHHVRKADAEDILDTINGTTGIAGAVDTALVLGRTQHGVRLAGRGRDSEDIDKLVEFDPDKFTWAITGEYDEADPKTGMAASRALILDLLTKSSKSLMPVQISGQLQLSRANVRQLLRRMVNNIPQQVIQNPDGTYAAVPVSG
jgi:hypothetical protein